MIGSRARMCNPYVQLAATTLKPSFELASNRGRPEVVRLAACHLNYPSLLLSAQFSGQPWQLACADFYPADGCCSSREPPGAIDAVDLSHAAHLNCFMAARTPGSNPEHCCMPPSIDAQRRKALSAWRTDEIV